MEAPHGAINWLEIHGLRKYEDILREAECLELDLILDFQDEELKELGLSTLGSRKKFLNAIKKSQNAGVCPCILHYIN